MTDINKQIEKVIVMCKDCESKDSCAENCACETTATEVKETKQRKPRATKEKAPLPPEQAVLLMSRLNPKLAGIIIKAAEKEGVKVVIFEDKVIYDYLEEQQKNSEATPIEKLTQFINDSKNRAKAEEWALLLWNKFTNMADLSLAVSRIFTKAQIVQNTTFTNKEVAELLNTLKVFGFLEFTKGTHEFKLIFGKETQRASVRADVVQSCYTLNEHIQRYKSVLEGDDSLSADKKKEEYAIIQKDVDSLVEF